MSILIKGVKRHNPQDMDAPMKWYPVQNSTGQVDETRVAELIADETTLNPAEALMAIRQLRKVTQRLLLDGHSVQLGNWGSFSVTLHTHGAETRETLTARNVDSVNIDFQAGTDLKTAMQKAEFVWIDKLVEGSSTPSPDAGSGDIVDPTA